MAPAIAHAVGLDAETELVPQLRERRLLLVLDNFEQVLDAAPAVGALLAALPTCAYWPRAARAWTSRASTSSP